MKLFELRGAFGLEQLQLAERPHPELQPGEAVVRIRAVSLNYRDLLVVHGKYDPRMKLPHIPVSDGAGEVVSVGNAITAWKPGDRVVIPFMPAWLDGALTAEGAQSALGGAQDGVLREYVTVPLRSLLPIPAHLSFEQAATLPCAAVTAWNGLFVSGNLQRGQTLLLQGTGGVSLFGLRFGKIAGARTILISSSDEKLARARTLGADHIINYKTNPNWEKRILELTGGNGVDLTLEVGGTGTLTKTLKATAYSGHVSLIGVLSGITGEVQLGHVLHKAIKMTGIYVGSRAMFAAMNEVISKHQMEPIIDRVFPFSESVEAFRYLATAQHFGKVVVRLD